jgi:hypothetical protein
MCALESNAWCVAVFKCKPDDIRIVLGVLIGKPEPRYSIAYFA